MNAFLLDNPTKRALFDFKSLAVYQKWLDKYVSWFLKSSFDSHCSNAVLDFLVSLETDYAASSMWQCFSCLSKWFLVCLNIDLDENLLIKDFMKKCSKIHLPKKSPTFSKEDVDKFLAEAPEDFLVVKCAIVVGLFGLSRISELVDLFFEDVTISDESFSFLIRKSKTDQAKKGFSFVVVPPYASHIKNYYSLFSPNQRVGRFFRKIENFKPTKKVIGKNILCTYPAKVALFLGFPDSGSYTGHCLRRTGATMLADTGVSKIILKQAGRWRSDTVCDGYIDESKSTKLTIANALAGTSAIAEKIQSNSSPVSSKIVCISNNSNCSFVLNI